MPKKTVFPKKFFFLQIFMIETFQMKQSPSNWPNSNRTSVEFILTTIFYLSFFFKYRV